MTGFGCDASDYDWSRGPFDVAAMARDGIVFLTHKATEATNIRHVHLAEALDRGRAAGIPILGAYHVVRSSPGVAAQVAYFFAYLDQAVPWWRNWPGFILQVDLEKWSYDPVTTPEAPARSLAQAQWPHPLMSSAETLRAAGTGADFTTALRAAAPRNAFVIVYASRGQYGNTLAGIGAPLWNANYPSSRAAPYRDLYPGDGGVGFTSYSGQKPTFWQYASTATIGSQPGCDINAFIGTPADLVRLVAGGTPDMPLTDADVEKIWAYKIPATGQSAAVTQSDNWNMINKGHSGFVPTDVAYIGQRLNGLTDAAKSDEVRDAALAAALAGTRTSVDALAAVIAAGGGNVDAAALIAAVHEAADRAAADATTLHAQLDAAAAREADLRARLVEALSAAPPPAAP